MRHAASYGIVDRKLLFDQYLHRMSLEEMALYLFLVLAADREGRSYYGGRSIAEILRLSFSELAATREGLIKAGLIDYRAPNWWVKSLSTAARRLPHSEGQSRDPVRGLRIYPAVCAKGELAAIRGVVPEALQALIRTLEEKP